MLKNYFKIAWRNLKKNKLYSAINILRLAQVMTTQIIRNESGTDESMSIPVGDALRKNYPNDIKYTSYTSWGDDHIIALDEKKLLGPGRWVQQDFPAMFTLKMLQGSRDALKDPSSLLISESLAKALFSDADAVNKIVRIDNKMDMKVGGVYADLPHNTTFYNTKL